MVLGSDLGTPRGTPIGTPRGAPVVVNRTPSPELDEFGEPIHEKNTFSKFKFNEKFDGNPLNAD